MNLKVCSFARATRNFSNEIVLDFLARAVLQVSFPYPPLRPLERANARAAGPENGITDDSLSAGRERSVKIALARAAAAEGKLGSDSAAPGK